nr:hypothetical protein [uncultured Faecalicatena sp.]
MDQLLELDAVTSLSEPLCKRYEGMTFDGNFFYLTLPEESKVCKFSRDFIFLHSFEVNRPYFAICYDSIEHCFWASEERLRHTIFRLDCDMEEWGEVQIRKCCAVSSGICGLSFHCQNETIIVAYENCTIELTREGEMVQVLQRSEKDENLGVLFVPPFLILVQRCRQKQFLKIFCREELIRCLCIPDCYKVKALIFCPCCGIERKKLVLFILVWDSCSCPCILKCVLDFCGKEICDCNFSCCCGREDCRCSIIESVAKSECALAHILNAEGEKLQKAVELADNICELLEVNRSVQRTITKVTFLEQVLYAKLETAANSVDKCEEK